MIIWIYQEFLKKIMISSSSMKHVLATIPITSFGKKIHPVGHTSGAVTLVTRKWKEWQTSWLTIFKNIYKLSAEGISLMESLVFSPELLDNTQSVYWRRYLNVLIYSEGFKWFSQVNLKSPISYESVFGEILKSKDIFSTEVEFWPWMYLHVVT